MKFLVYVHQNHFIYLLLSVVGMLMYTCCTFLNEAQESCIPK